MPIETTRDKGQDLTIHVVTGPVFEAQMYRTLEDFYDREPTALVLWDMSQAELSQVTPDMLQKFIRRAAEIGVRRQGGRTAVVASDDLQFGLARMSVPALAVGLKLSSGAVTVTMWESPVDHRLPLSRTINRAV